MNDLINWIYEAEGKIIYFEAMRSNEPDEEAYKNAHIFWCVRLDALRAVADDLKKIGVYLL